VLLFTLSLLKTLTFLLRIRTNIFFLAIKVSLLDQQPTPRSKKRSSVCLTRAQFVRALYAGDERTECKPSLVSEQQLNPEAHYTQKQLSSHNLTLFHKKESTQLSKAEACWHKHRYTNRLLILTSFITMWVGLTNAAPLSIVQFVTYSTGFYGLMASEIFKPRQRAQPAQQQAQMMLGNFLVSC